MDVPVIPALSVLVYRHFSFWEITSKPTCSKSSPLGRQKMQEQGTREPPPCCKHKGTAQPCGHPRGPLHSELTRAGAPRALGLPPLAVTRSAQT